VLALLTAGALLLRFPPLVELEGSALDLKFRHGRIDPPAPSAKVVHLDIDDNALETAGRWPWPRKLLADAVAAIDRMGARVIAIDVLLLDPQKPRYQADGTRIDHDALLAAALEKCTAKTVLATTIDDSATRLSRLWTTREGRERWRAVLDTLRQDISLTPDTVIRRAGLRGERAARVRGRIGAIKEIVVFEAAERLRAAGRTVDEESLRAALLPREKDANLKEFPALHVIREVVARRKSTAAAERHFPDAVPGHPYARVERLLPPRPAFARAVDYVGIVNAVQDGDGALRRVRLRWVKDGKVYPQFGLAAVAAYSDLPLDFLARPEIAHGEFVPGGEEMLLSWPRIDPSKPILGLAQHVSLGRVLDLLSAEETHARLQRDYEAHTRRLVRELLGASGYSAIDLADPAKRVEVVEELANEVEFQLQGVTADTELGDQERDKINACRLWRNLSREISLAAQVVTYARRELRSALEDRLVFIGWYATGNFGDFYPTAVHERTPGVIAHGAVANAVLTGYVVRAGPLWVGALLTLLLGAFASLLTARLDPRLGFLLTLLLAVVFVAADTLLVFNQWNTAVAAATPLLGLFAAWAGTVAMNAVRALREKAQLRRQFGARISKRLFDYLIEHPDQVHLEGEEKEVTCFFSDLQGFTGISESLDSKKTVALLNRYMWAMNDELTKLYAYVNKFLGDGVMAVWGTFAVDSPHADRACRAALACVKRLETLNEGTEFEGLPKLAMRIGIATGVVTVGDCGAPPDLRDYTVIGDSANLAARLESANKQFGTRILINGRCRELISDDLLTRPLGRITVVGQQTATEIHELVALRDEATPEQLDLVEMTANAVRLFQERKLDEAKAAWAVLLETHGESKLCRLYLQEIEICKRHADEPFEGVLQLTSK